jgi:hypothetical protein
VAQPLAVLGEDDAAVRRHGDVVRAVEAALDRRVGVLPEDGLQRDGRVGRVENQTWPSWVLRLPSPPAPLRAKLQTKYAPPSPHHWPSSLRLR